MLPRRALFLSKGTVDQIYLAVRLAVYDLCLKERRAPLVLDDALAAFDDRRMVLALELLEELARCTFNETERFERVLMMQMAELRKLGAVVVITTRLTSEVADLLIRMKRMGPNVRLYYVTFRTDRPQRLALVGRLQQAGVEVNYVTPQGS